ncbi:MAG TPA: hypothetical protein VGR73_01125 [Bryobacteraceae bacterium]|nr:hypothetical protein [Bryobacteraceae bacterium]
MRRIASLLFFTGLCFADTVFSGGGVFPHVADGGGNQTAMTLVNLDDTANTYTLTLYSDGGTPLTMATSAGTGSTFSGTLQPHASVTITTAGVSLTVAQGWGQIKTMGTIGGSALFRISIPPWIGSEAMVPADTNLSNRFAFVYDNSAGIANGVALVNPFSFESITVFVAFRDENGGEFALDSFVLGPLNHFTFVVTQRYPSTIGHRGTFEISTTGPWMNALGLRFGTSAISTILPLVSILW